MSQTLFFIVVCVVLLVVAVFSYMHKHHKEFNPYTLKVQVERIFKEAQSKQMKKKDFLQRMKNRYSCTQKEATYLLGKARKFKMIELEADTVVQL